MQQMLKIYEIMEPLQVMCLKQFNQQSEKICHARLNFQQGIYTNEEGEYITKKCLISN